MLENGDRGLFIDFKLNHDVENIESVIKDAALYKDKVIKAVNWSRQYTLDVFENEIKLLLQS